MPVRINSNWRLESLPTSSVSNSRSRVMIWEALATESLGRPVARAGRSTLPGASAHRRLLVKGTQTTLLIRLRLSASPWTTRTGLRKTGTGTCWIWKVCPIHMALGNYHSTPSRVRLAAAEMAGSGYVSTASQTRFIASVTASGS
jgi:hypothetical protein